MKKLNGEFLNEKPFSHFCRNGIELLDSIIPNRLKETDFNIILFKNIDTFLSLTETKNLPGFDEWYKNK